MDADSREEVGTHPFGHQAEGSRLQMIRRLFVAYVNSGIDRPGDARITYCLSSTRLASAARKRLGVRYCVGPEWGVA